MYTLERATAADLPAIIRLASDNMTERYDEAFFLTMVELQEPTFLVARDGATDQVVAFSLAVRSTPYEARLLLLATDPGHRGLGIGSRLLREVERAMRIEGVLECDLEVRDDNMDAIAFYRRAGYEIHGAVPEFYADGGRAITMGKGL